MSAASRARERKNGLETIRRSIWIGESEPGRFNYNRLDKGLGYVINVGLNLWTDPLYFGATRKRLQPNSLIMLVVLPFDVTVALSDKMEKIIVTVPTGEMFGSGAVVSSVQSTADNKYQIVELVLLSKLLPVKKTIIPKETPA